MQYQIISNKQFLEGTERKKKAQKRYSELVKQLEYSFKKVNESTRQGNWDDCSKALKVCRDIVSELQALALRYYNLDNKSKLSFLDTIESSDFIQSFL